MCSAFDFDAFVAAGKHPLDRRAHADFVRGAFGLAAAFLRHEYPGYDEQDHLWRSRIDSYLDALRSIFIARSYSSHSDLAALTSPSGMARAAFGAPGGAAPAEALSFLTSLPGCDGWALPHEFPTDALDRQGYCHMCTCHPLHDAFACETARPVLAAAGLMPSDPVLIEWHREWAESRTVPLRHRISLLLPSALEMLELSSAAALPENGKASPAQAL